MKNKFDEVTKKEIYFIQEIVLQLKKMDSFIPNKINYLKRKKMELETEFPGKYKNALNKIATMIDTYEDAMRKNFIVTKLTAPTISIKNISKHYFHLLETEFNRVFDKWKSISKYPEIIEKERAEFFQDICSSVYYRIRMDDNLRDTIIKLNDIFLDTNVKPEQYPLHYICEKPFLDMFWLPQFMLADFIENKEEFEKKIQELKEENIYKQGRIDTQDKWKEQDNKKRKEETDSMVKSYIECCDQLQDSEPSPQILAIHSTVSENIWKAKLTPKKSSRLELLFSKAFLELLRAELLKKVNYHWKDINKKEYWIIATQFIIKKYEHTDQIIKKKGFKELQYRDDINSKQPKTKRKKKETSDEQFGHDTHANQEICYVCSKNYTKIEGMCRDCYKDTFGSSE